MNPWIFDELDEARENFLQKVFRRKAMPEEYQGDPFSIQVYREKYLPKLEAMHNRMQAAIKSVQYKDKENRLWRAVEYIPFQPCACHVGVFEVIAINMQDPPRDVLKLYGGETRDAYEKMTLEIRQNLWPVICKIIAPYKAEAQMIHGEVEVECFDDKLDSVFGVFLKFHPKEIDKQGRFEPGLENWLFDETTPAQESAGDTALMVGGTLLAAAAVKSKLMRSRANREAANKDIVNLVGRLQESLMHWFRKHDVNEYCVMNHADDCASALNKSGSSDIFNFWFPEDDYDAYWKKTKLVVQAIKETTLYTREMKEANIGMDVMQNREKGAVRIIKPRPKERATESNGWLFDGVRPNADPSGTTGLLFEGVHPAEEALFTPAAVRKASKANLDKINALSTIDLVKMYIELCAKEFPQYHTSDEDFEREKEAFTKAAMYCCEGYWGNVEEFSIGGLHGIIASPKNPKLRGTERIDDGDTIMCLYVNMDVKLRWCDGYFAYLAISKQIKAPFLAKNVGKPRALIDYWMVPCNPGQPCDVNVYL